MIPGDDKLSAGLGVLTTVVNVLINWLTGDMLYSQRPDRLRWLEELGELIEDDWTRSAWTTIVGMDSGSAGNSHVLHLDDLDLTRKLKSPEYEERLEAEQKKLVQLQRKIVEGRMRVVLVFEGVDAAGKGGVIRRLVQFLDPRGYEVHPIGAPDSHDKLHHHMRRFWLRLPAMGRMAIFDRSWYGRVLVEPIEGFCTDEEYQRAPKEIREFERELADDGYCLMKFWLHIDSETQLKRFNSRKNDPLRRWKLTDEDWRNREKFDAYSKYANAMFAATHTPHAPWHLIPASNKPYARVRVLRIINKTIKHFEFNG